SRSESLITNHQSLGVELDDCGSRLALAFLAEAVALHMGMGFEKVVHGLPQRAGALAVDDGDAAQSGHERLVEVFVQDRDGVVDRHATQAERGGYRTGQIGRSRAAPDWRRRGTNRCGARGPPRTTRFASLLITRSTLRIELVRGP